MTALNALEKASAALTDPAPTDVGGLRTAYRAAQRDYAGVLATVPYDGRPLWLVSDFVTLGAPLSKGDILLAKDAAELDLKKGLREVPCCPPILEKKSPPRFSFPLREPVRTPHHAAVFGPTVWTNIFFDSRLLVFGDVVAGPIARLFGRGILDVQLPIEGLRFRHLDYWAEPASTPPRYWIRALRRAINLRLLDDPALWADYANASVVDGRGLRDRTE